MIEHEQGIPKFVLPQRQERNLEFMSSQKVQVADRRDSD